MHSIYKRGRCWWVSCYANGRRVRKSLRTAIKRTAEQRAQDAEERVFGGISNSTWKDFEREFLSWVQAHVKSSTLKKYEFLTHRFSRFLFEYQPMITGLGQLSPSLISEYVQDRRRDRHPTKGIPVGQEGIKSDLRILRRVFSYAIQAGHMRSNPVRFPRLNTNPGKTQPFSQSEIDRMLADTLLRSRPDLKAIVLMFLHTGLRISDLIDFPREALDLEDGTMVLRTRKRGTFVSLGVHPTLSSALEKHLAAQSPIQTASPLLFSSATGKRLVSLDAYLRRLWRRCRVEHAHAHRFRDTFACRLLEKGASLYDVSKLLGITVGIAERHYSPYVRELQERGRRLVNTLDFTRSKERMPAQE